MKANIDGETEFERFDKALRKLLAVPYSELRRRLKKEERAKAKRKARKA